MLCLVSQVDYFWVHYFVWVHEPGRFHFKAYAVWLVSGCVGYFRALFFLIPFFFFTFIVASFHSKRHVNIKLLAVENLAICWKLIIIHYLKPIQNFLLSNVNNPNVTASNYLRQFKHLKCYFYQSSVVNVCFFILLAWFYMGVLACGSRIDFILNNFHPHTHTHTHIKKINNCITIFYFNLPFFTTIILIIQRCEAKILTLDFPYWKAQLHFYDCCKSYQKRISPFFLSS